MKKRYWRISPGERGYLWREQRLNECIALGWSDIGNAKKLSRQKLQDEFRKRGWSSYGANQLFTFVHDVKKGHRVVASASGKGVYAVGTVISDYQFDKDLEYSHSRKVSWETIFWHPVPISDLRLPVTLYNKFHGRSSKTIRQLSELEWDQFWQALSGVTTPFRNLQMWGGLIQSPEYENEVMILFSHMLQHFHMRIAGFGTRFPDAIVERKNRGRWKRVNIEFELYSSGFRHHLSECDKKHCDAIVCWEDDWRDRKKGRFEVIELKHELERML